MESPIEILRDIQRLALLQHDPYCNWRSRRPCDCGLAALRERIEKVLHNGD